MSRLPWLVCCLAVALLGAAIPGCSQAHAEPAMPDFSAFEEVNADAYTYNDIPTDAGLIFATPTGWNCSTSAREGHKHLWCHGPRTDVGGYWDLWVSAESPAKLRQTDAPATSGSSRPLLPAMHKLTFRDFTCAVDDHGMFACQAGAHGFVVTPTTTRVY